MVIKTKHGKITCPNFFPIIGWPAGRGEYDRLFETLDYFCKKIKHNHFLFNFSSFAFGFVIPEQEFNKIFESFRDVDLRNSLIKFTKIKKSTANSLIILLDVGGNRIFNKIVYDKKDPSKFESFKPYIDAYFNFIKKADIDIYVSFDVGPSYSTRDEISKEGVKIWNCLPSTAKNKLNRILLEESLKRKEKDELVMVPIGATDLKNFRKHLKNLFSKYEKSIDYLAIGGIANQGYEYTEKILKALKNFLTKTQWNVRLHGLGLGGWKNVPLLVKYRIDTCDVATPWRRSCTDAISNIYVPLFDEKLNLTSYEDAFKYYEIYDKIWDKISCKCPFCKDMPIKEMQKIYKKADKDHSGESKHHNDYYNIRVRIFYHNVFQHIAFLKKLSIYKEKYSDRFLEKFSKEVKSERIKEYLEKLS